jgi:uncharacterized lipoprotein
MQRLLAYAAFVAVVAGCSSGSSAERTRFSAGRMQSADS